MAKQLNIVIIGAGNLAHHLCEAFHHTNINIVQVFNHRRSKQALLLSKKTKSPLVTDYKSIVSSADVYLVCVKDEAIGDVAKQLKNLALQGIVLHTSGSTNLAMLQKVFNQCGVFYPLQTFSIHDQVNWAEIPILVEGSSPKTLTLVKKLAGSVSHKVVVCDSEERLKIHLAAVLSGNFSNALYALTYDYMKKEIPGKHFDLLKPLIRQTVRKLDKLSPAEAQTGPARRGDLKTIQKHLALLKDYPETKAIYKLMTKVIAGKQR